MPIRVLLKDHPHRTLALTSDDYALVFRHTHSADQGYSSSSTSLTVQSSNRHLGQNLSPRCMVEFAPYASIDFMGYRTLGSAQGTLGLITLNNDVFLCTVTSASQVASPRPGETVQKIQFVDFCKISCSMITTNAKPSFRLSQPTRLRPWTWTRNEPISWTKLRVR
jgi:synaptojanin